MSFKTFLILTVFLFFAPALHAQKKDSSRIYSSGGEQFRFEVLTQQKDVVWGFDFLGDGRIIFTERGGALRIYDPKTKKVTGVQGAPKVWADGQGGLLDIRVHPKDKNRIYLTYSEPIDNGATTAFASATLSGSELTQFKKLFSAKDASSNEIHFGSRIEFDGAGHIFITVGDRNDRPKVQDLKYHMGKILRFNEDGTVPKDNPFVKTKGAQPEIWALGIRNAQGLVRHPITGDLWSVEMGPRGGDEINVIKPGLNYGWPVITYGREYWGPKIGEGERKAGMEQPVVYWVPSLSPSGTTIYNGDVFPKWKGNMFVGMLATTHLRRLTMDGQKITNQEELLKDLSMRIRNVRPGPDGFIYLSTDDGKIARLVPR
ncbi:Soluble aldose sugar dehydrogenase YliI precursor [compost metagenome]